MSSFNDILHKWSKVCPNKVAYHFLSDSGDICDKLTYSQLVQKSSFIAKNLLNVHKLKSGDRVLLVYPPSLDFIVAFIACLLSGIIAVPAFPPDPTRLAKDVVIFNSIITSSGATCALTSDLYRNAFKLGELKHLFINGKSQMNPVTWITTDRLLREPDESEIVPPQFESPLESDVAFLQYTSGSTSEPKGVIVTHGNLSHNLQLIISGLSATEDTVVVSWLPQYHDMGLIGSYLGALFCGGTGFYLSPYSFIRNPVIWILCMSRYRATHIQAPNFAYTLTARKFLSKTASKRSDNSSDNHLQEIDLSSIRHMINAAEPVDSTSIESFYGVFERFGLKRGVIFPTYGLAEHTVYVCSNGQQRLVVDKTAMENSKTIEVLGDSLSLKGGASSNSSNMVVLMGCGKPTDSDEVDLRIVDTEALTALSDDRVGEIWIRSPSMARGYWGLEGKTESDFRATLKSDDTKVTSPEFLRTGDLGFLHNQELFVCGRLKDLIIIRGRNHYPQDIERTCENVVTSFGNKICELRKGCSAAFSVPVGGQERLIYVAELGDLIKPGYVSLEEGNTYLEQLRSEIRINHGISVSTVLLLPSRSIHKTSSGKIARQWIRKSYLEGSLKSQYSWSDLDASTDVNSSDVIFAPTCSLKSMEPAVQDDTAVGDNLMSNNELMDPTGLPLEVVIAKLTQAVAQCLQTDVGGISPNVPLSSLGMDSMQSIALQSILDSSFSVALPDELMFETDATLQTLARCLVNGGSYTHRPVMLLGSDLYEAARKNELSKPYNKTFLGQYFGFDATTTAGREKMSDMLSPQWMNEHQVKSHVDTLLFPDGCALRPVPLRPYDDAFAILYSFLFFGVFMWLPIVVSAVFLVFSFKIAATILLLFLSAVYLVPCQCYPACFRTGWAVGLVNRYYSYRMIIEAPRECYTGVPSIYSFGPHGVFSISPVIQVLLNEFALGENMHFLAASAALLVPVYNVYLKMMGFRSVDRKSFKDTLLSGRSVGIIPGGIAEMLSTSAQAEVMNVQDRKGFIAIALETGCQVIPCYCFGNTQTFSLGSNRYLDYLSRVWRMSLIVFWGRFGLPVPFRAPQITVVGKPLLVPKVPNPSMELINDYHEQYLRETRRIYEKYKNTYNWRDRRLIFKR